MLLTKSALILNENETMSYLCHSQETQADRHAASSPSKGQEQPIHSHVGNQHHPAPKPCSRGKTKKHLHWKIKAKFIFLSAKLFGLDKEMAWGLSDFSSQIRFQIGILHPTSLKDVRNPPNVLMLNRYNKREYIFGLNPRSCALALSQCMIDALWKGSETPEHAEPPK